MSKKQQINKWTETIDQVVEVYNELSEVCEQCIDAGCMDVEGKLWSAIWNSFDTMLDCIDDKSDWVSWHIYENNCGKNKYEAKASNQKNSKIIATSRDLAKLIVKDMD